MLEEDPDFPVAPAWPDQDGAGAHTNLSGVGLVKGSEHRADAIALMEHLTGARRRRSEIAENCELAANPDVAARRAHRATGPTSSATRSTSSAPARCCPTRSR